ISSATMLMILISGLTAGPAVSLYGSPTVSPVTAALWASLPLPPWWPSSMYFFALSQAPPPVHIEMATKRPVTIVPISRPPSAAGAHRDGDEEAGDDRSHQQAAERRRAEQKADQDRHDHRQQARDHHLLDRRLGQHVDRGAVLGLAGAFHDALDVAELAPHLDD